MSPNWDEEVRSFLEVTYVEIFFGHVWENPGQILSHTQNFACSYTNGPQNHLTRKKKIVALRKIFIFSQQSLLDRRNYWCSLKRQKQFIF